MSQSTHPAAFTDQLSLGEPLHDAVRDVLSTNPYFVGRNLRVDFEHTAVILRGSVRTYHQKQIAGASVRRIQGVGAIRNELEVVAN